MPGSDNLKACPTHARKCSIQDVGTLQLVLLPKHTKINTGC
jgi:hypothetical protein